MRTDLEYLKGMLSVFLNSDSTFITTIHDLLPVD